ncbi:MAG: CDP-alcohol phosphatidyltransferase family protein [Clostridiales bacterium]|nr:CDP-alcohol phosphatidyltransferase family protein [Clostridiales bacterium]
MKKQLANIITSARIIGAVVLFFFKDVNGAFLCIYAFCGLTDLIDGPVARKTQSESSAGALLDTVGDIATYVALAKILLSKHLVPSWVLCWYIPAAVSILCSGFIAFARFRHFFVIHSLFGKLMGLTAFLMPFALRFGIIIPCFVAMCVTATVSAIETAVITVKSEDPEHDAASIAGMIIKNR